MKINIKTLKGTDFNEVNLDESATVEQLKEKIAEEKQKDKDTIKLVHKGKQLNDGTKTLGEVGIKENDFIILMFFVKKVEEPSQPPTSSQVNPSSISQTGTNSQAPTNNIPPQVVPSTTTASSSQKPSDTANNQNTSSNLLSGPELEEKIKDLQEMGFERPQILQALQAAFYNAERAVEYLLSGNIPQVPTNTQAAQNQGEGQGGQGRATPEQLMQLAQLAQNPQFQQISQLIRANPNLLQPILTQLAQTNPEITRIITQHPQEFIALLFGGQPREGGGVPRGSIQVTPEEKADIDEIVSLGFNKSDVLEAYISCDKNKELAINYLFDARENGTLLSEHIQKEQAEAAQQGPTNPQQQPPANQNDPPNQNPPKKDDKDDKDDEDDFLY